MERLIDTNIILRYLLNDIPEVSKEVYNILKEGYKIYPEVLAEATYVLEDFYNVPRKEIEYGLMEVIDYGDMDDKNIYVEALSIYKNTNFDFVDCMLIARSKIYGDSVYTFDKKLKNKLNSYDK